MDVGTGFVDILPRSEAFFGSLKTQIDSQLGAIEASTASRSAALMHGIGTAVIGVGAAIAVGIGKSVEATVQWAAQVHQLQLVTGMSAEAASGLLGAAGQYGIGVDKLSTSIGFLEKNVVANTPAVAKWGVTARDAAGNLLPVDQILGNVADKFVQLGGPGGVGTAFIKTLGGRGGQSLIPLLQGGAAGLQAMEEHAKSLGLVMSQDDVDAAYKLALAQHTLGESIKGAAINIGEDFLPVAKLMVDGLSAVFQGVAKLPAPLVEIGAAVPAAAAALTLLWRAGGFLAEGFKGVVGLFGETAVAATAPIAPTVGLTAAIEALTESLGVALPAAAAKADVALAGFEATEGGLLVPTGAAAAETGVAIGGLETANVGLIASMGGLATIIPPVLGALTVAGVLMKADADTAAAFAANVDKATAALEAGGAAAARIRATASTLGMPPPPNPIIPESAPGPQIGFGGRLGGGAVIAAHMAYVQQQSDAKAASEALAAYNAQQALVSQSSVVLAGNIRATFDAIANSSDPTAPLPGHVFDLLNASVTQASNGMDDFAKRSGLDSNSILATLSTSLADIAKKTGDQTKAITDAYKVAIGGEKGLWNQWHDQIAGSLNQTSTDLGKFSSSAHIDPAKLRASLQQSIQDTRAFGSDIQAITQSGVKGIGDQTTALIALGPQYAAAMVKADGTVRKNLVGTFVTAENSANSSATGIEKALAPVFDKMLLALKNVVRAIEGLPPIKLDTSVAIGNVNSLRSAVDSLAAALAKVHLPGNGLGGANAGGSRGPDGGAPLNTGLAPVIPLVQPTAIPLVPAARTDPSIAAAIDRAVDRQTNVILAGLKKGSTFHLADWRNGIGSLESELDWADSNSGW